MTAELEPVVRPDALAKATGRAIYGVDLVAPRMLHGAVVRSREPHARIRAVRSHAARKVPGVQAFLTADDAPDVRHGVVVHDQPMLARELVRYHGEPIALIAAETAGSARWAAQLVEIEYEPLPLIMDPELAMVGGPFVHPDWESYQGRPGLRRVGNICAHVTLQHGELDEAFAGATLVVEGTYEAPSAHQCPLEPHAALAEWEPDGSLVVTTSTQHPFGIRGTLARLFELPLNRVRVVVPTVGGGFGAKLDVAAEPLAALLSRHTGRPVKVVFSRTEEFESGMPRHPTRVRLRTALREDGTITGRDARIVLDAGAYTGDTPIIASVAANLGVGPYRVANYRVESIGVLTNKQNFNAFRGPSGPQVVFAVESHMDECAHRLGLDPLEFRRRNHLGDGDIAPNGQLLEAVGLREVLEAAADAVGWREPKPQFTGRGIACTWWTTTGGSTGAEMELNPDGSVTVRCGGTEIGTGAVAASLPQIVARELGLKPSQVRVLSGDTANAPYDFGSQGSRTVFNHGRALIAAAAEVRAQLLDRAADQLEVDPTDLELAEGNVRVRGVPSRSVEIREIAAASLASGGPILGKGASLPDPPPHDAERVSGSIFSSFNAPTFAAHAVEIEIDPGTGAIRIKKYAAAHDVGRLLNEVYARGQVQGGVTQGIGYALFEESIIENGRVVTNDFTSYRLPSVLDTLPVECIFIERPSEQGPYGAKGLGEPPIIPPAAAIANALADAIGSRLYSLPLTPAKVFSAIERHDTPAIE